MYTSTSSDKVKENVMARICSLIDELVESKDSQRQQYLFDVFALVVMSNTKLLVCGMGASGKDTLINSMVTRLPDIFKKMIWNTTRPIRDGENDGVDYHFSTTVPVDVDDLVHLALYNVNGLIWAYWLTKTEWNLGNVTVVSPEFLHDDKTIDLVEDSIVFYLEVSESERIQRLNLRNDADSVERRIKSDNISFKDISNYYDYIIES